MAVGPVCSVNRARGKALQQQHVCDDSNVNTQSLCAVNERCGFLNGEEEGTLLANKSRFAGNQIYQVLAPCHGAATKRRWADGERRQES